MKIKSKIGDGMFIGLIVLSVVTLAMFVVWVVTNVWWPTIVMLAIMGIGILPIYFGTYYELTNYKLCIYSGLIGKQIPYQNIISMTDADNLVPSFALSSKKICIRYFDKDKIKQTYVSPANREQFRELVNSEILRTAELAELESPEEAKARKAAQKKMDAAKKLFNNEQIGSENCRDTNSAHPHILSKETIATNENDFFVFSVEKSSQIDKKKRKEEAKAERAERKLVERMRRMKEKEEIREAREAAKLAAANKEEIALLNAIKDERLAKTIIESEPVTETPQIQTTPEPVTVKKRGRPKGSVKAQTTEKDNKTTKKSKPKVSTVKAKRTTKTAPKTQNKKSTATKKSSAKKATATKKATESSSTSTSTEPKRRGRPKKVN